MLEKDVIERKFQWSKFIIGIFCALFIVFEFVSIPYTKDSVRNAWIGRILSNTCAAVAVIGVMRIMRIRLFKRPKNVPYLIPAIIIALANFPLVSYIRGNMQIVRGEWIDVMLFILYCCSVGVLEELIFRGVLFATLADTYSKDVKGMWKTYVMSSLVFGLAHLTNILRGAGIGPTLLQAVYTTLTGGLFAYVLLKTQNVLCCAGIHALYNICGLIFETPARFGLGSGVVFDFGTGFVMAIIDVLMGIFVLYSVFKIKEEEKTQLYECLSIKLPK